MRRFSLGIAVVAALMAAAPAFADGDPASDYLLTRAVFQPLDLGTSHASQAQLSAIVLAAKAKGYRVRVAVIGTRYDLGSVPILFRKPEEYARFLGQELHFIYKGRLLVVMPNGYGVSLEGKAQPNAQQVVDRLAAPGTGGTAMTAAAVLAVQRLAASAGVTVAVPKLTGATGTDTNHDRLVIAAVVAAALAFGTGLLFAWRRLRRSGVV